MDNFCYINNGIIWIVKTKTLLKYSLIKYFYFYFLVQCTHCTILHYTRLIFALFYGNLLAHFFGRTKLHIHMFSFSITAQYFFFQQIVSSTISKKCLIKKYMYLYKTLSQFMRSKSCAASFWKKRPKSTLSTVHALFSCFPCTCFSKVFSFVFT